MDQCYVCTKSAGTESTRVLFWYRDRHGDLLPIPHMGKRAEVHEWCLPERRAEIGRALRSLLYVPALSS